LAVPSRDTAATACALADHLLPAPSASAIVVERSWTSRTSAGLARRVVTVGKQFASAPGVPASMTGLAPASIEIGANPASGREM